MLFGVWYGVWYGVAQASLVPTHTNSTPESEVRVRGVCDVAGGTCSRIKIAPKNSGLVVSAIGKRYRYLFDQIVYVLPARAGLAVMIRLPRETVGDLERGTYNQVESTHWRRFRGVYRAFDCTLGGC